MFSKKLFWTQTCKNYKQEHFHLPINANKLSRTKVPRITFRCMSELIVILKKDVFKLEKFMKLEIFNRSLVFPMKNDLPNLSQIEIVLVKSFH